MQLMGICWKQSLISQLWSGIERNQVHSYVCLGPTNPRCEFDEDLKKSKFSLKKTQRGVYPLQFFRMKILTFSDLPQIHTVDYWGWDVDRYARFIWIPHSKAEIWSIHFLLITAIVIYVYFGWGGSGWVQILTFSDLPQIHRVGYRGQDVYRSVSFIWMSHSEAEIRGVDFPLITVIVIYMYCSD